MRKCLLVVIIALFCTSPLAVAQYPVNDTQKTEIQVALDRALNHGGVGSFSVKFGSDMLSPIMAVKFEPDVYGGMTPEEMEESIASTAAKIIHVHLDMLKKYRNLDNLELQITYWKPGLGTIIRDRPITG